LLFGKAEPFIGEIFTERFSIAMRTVSYKSFTSFPSPKIMSYLFYGFRHFFKNNISYFFLYAAICLAYAQPWADSTETDIRYAAELDQLPTGCRTAAMGNSGVSQPFDASGIFWNPAASSFTKSYDMSAEYASLYGGLSSQACAAFRAPLQDNMSVGILYEPFFSGDINLWDTLEGTYLERLMDASKRTDGSSSGVFTNTQHNLSISFARLFNVPVPRPTSYSYPLPIEFSAGIGFKGYWQTMNPDKKLRMGMNVNCDAGLMLHIGIDYDLLKKNVSREIYAGFSVKDFLGTKVIWIHSPTNYQEKVDRTEYFGLSYIDKTGIAGADWTVALGGERSYTTIFQGGIEARFWNILSFRAGLSDQTFTTGVGISYKKYQLDYAFSFDDLAYSPLRLSLGYSF
jgi:hypothetical protein